MVGMWWECGDQMVKEFGGKVVNLWWCKLGGFYGQVVRTWWPCGKDVVAKW